MFGTSVLSLTCGVMLILFFSSLSGQLCTVAPCIEGKFSCTYVTYIDGVRVLNAYLGYKSSYRDVVIDIQENILTDGNIVSGEALQFQGEDVDFAVHITNLTRVRWDIGTTTFVKNITYNRTELCTELHGTKCGLTQPLPLSPNFCEDGVFCNGLERCLEGNCAPALQTVQCSGDTPVCSESALACTTTVTPAPTIATPRPTVATPRPTVATPRPTVATPRPTVATPGSPSPPPAQNGPQLSTVEGVLIGIGAVFWFIAIVFVCIRLRRRN